MCTELVKSSLIAPASGNESPIQGLFTRYPESGHNLDLIRNVINSFERLYDGLWARREAGHEDDDSPAKAGNSSASRAASPADEKRGASSCKRAGGTVLRGTNRGTQWSMAAEVTHLQRRVADLAAELQV